MANTLTISGRLTADPELRFTSSGKAVASFTVADNHRRRGPGGDWQDDGTTFLQVTVWEGLAENVADRFSKGDFVSVTGELRQRDWEDRAGNKRVSYELRGRTVASPVPVFVDKSQGSDAVTEAPF
jgi:single-strand DNA-binding protein